MEQPKSVNSNTLSIDNKTSEYTNKDDQINEEYKIWKKNSPYLYDTLIQHQLEWPSLTFSWFPDKEADSEKDYTIHRILLGTHTSDDEPNNIVIGKIKIPNEKYSRSIETSFPTYGGYEKGIGSINIVQKIRHSGEVNRARYMPQNPDVIATKTNCEKVFVFDKTKHPSFPLKDAECKPDLNLLGHSKEGYGISWNLHSKGKLISGSDDHLICLWDINTPNTGNISPLSVFKEHLDIVEDVAWSPFNASWFGSASDDKTIKMWDIRDSKKAKFTIKAHHSEINSIAFNNFQEYLIISGSTDKTAALWDIRNPNKRLHLFETHTSQIFKVEWSTFSENIAASCSADMKVNIWDLSKIGEEQTPEDAADGPPELCFIHGGHTDRVSDFSWNLNDSWLLGSVADNNIIQIWKVAQDIFIDDKEVDDEEVE